MENLRKYIQNLDFEYAISYSGLRTPNDKAGDIYYLKIIDMNGKLHSSAKAVHQFKKGDKDINEIFEVLNMEFEHHLSFLCAPVFRDAIVFYTSENKISGILHICFGCTQIVNENERNMEVDYKIYPILQESFIRLGHEISADDIF